MPTKDTSFSFVETGYAKSWREDLGPDPGWTSSGSKTQTVTRTRTGDRLPKWRELIENGENATTDMSATYDSVESTGTRKYFYVRRKFPGTNAIQTFANLGYFLQKNGQQDLSMPVPSLDSSFVDNLARANFFKKLHQVERSFQGYVFLGELTETLRMLKHPAQGLKNLASDFLGLLRKRKKANPKGWTKDLGGLWLENAFGWQPLINDVKDAIKDWQRLTDPNPPTQRISAGAKKGYGVSSGTGFNKPGTIMRPFSSGCAWRVTSYSLVEFHICRFRGSLRSQVEAPSWQDWTLFGFQPKEFIPAAWELLPWSFLIDYFTNIGDILDASVTSTRNLVYLNKSLIRTRTESKRIDLEPDYDIPAAGWITLDHSANSRVTSTKTRKVVSRSKNAGFYLPRLQFNFSLSDGQLGNCAALLSQANALHPQRSPRVWHR